MTTLLLRPTLEKKPYRLKCRFKIEPAPSPVADFAAHGRWRARLEREKVTIAERFVTDMAKYDPPWINLPDHGFKLRGPFPMIAPMEIKVPRIPTAREMEAAVRQGARFLDTGRDYAKPLPKLEFSEWWEFELSAFFVREEILVEYPDAHEEEHL